MGILGQDLDKSIGGNGSSAKEMAKEQAYYRLDLPFRRWLMQIDPEQNLEEQSAHVKEWRKTSKDIIRNLGKELVDQAGTIAIAGRTVKEKIKNKEVERHYSAPEAFNYFICQLSRLEQRWR